MNYYIILSFKNTSSSKLIIKKGLDVLGVSSSTLILHIRCTLFCILVLCCRQTTSCNHFSIKAGILLWECSVAHSIAWLLIDICKSSFPYTILLVVTVGYSIMEWDLTASFRTWTYWYIQTLTLKSIITIDLLSWNLEL